MNDTRNKTIDENFNFKDWVEDLRADFFMQAYSRSKELDRLNKFQSAIKSAKDLLDVIVSEPEKIHVKNFIELLSSSEEYSFLKLMARKRPKKKGPRSPWNSHLKLVIYALESAKGDKFLLNEIRKTLQTVKNGNVSHNKESIYNWSKKISPEAQSELPAFRSVNTKSTKTGATMWANEMKRAYIKNLQKNDQKLKGKNFYFKNKPYKSFKINLKTVIID